MGMRREDKYISAEWLLRKLFPYDVVDKGSYAINAKAVYLAIEEAPAVDVAEIRHGHWIYTENGCVILCSECGGRLELCYPDGTEVTRLDYCNMCGAKMDGESEDTE